MRPRNKFENSYLALPEYKELDETTRLSSKVTGAIHSLYYFDHSLCWVLIEK
jgi:hypothetical protein